MARPIKDGCEYFPHDVDSSNDEKMESVEAIFGNDGYSTYFKLLERIYRKGWCLDISATETRQILGRKCNISVEKLSEMVTFMAKVGLFDATEFEKGLLTSDGIKKRYDVITKKRRRERGKLEIPDTVSGAETGTGTPESKEKESKVKKTKAEENKPSAATYSQEFTAKAELAIAKGFNIYKLAGKYLKDKAFTLPEKVLDHVLNRFLNNTTTIENQWAYFLAVLADESKSYNAGNNEAEGIQAKGQPVAAGTVLKQLAESLR